MSCTFQNTIKCEDVVIVVDSDEELCDNNNILGNPLSKTKEKKCQRKVTLDRKNKAENLIITQEVKMNKQIFKCVIDFNTNVSDYNCYGLNKAFPEIIDQRELKDRIVPTCWRLKCKGAYYRKRLKPKCNDRRDRQKIYNCKQRRNGHQAKSHKKSDHSITKTIKYARCHNNKYDTFKKEHRKVNLSPISTSHISYDEISMDSLTSWSNSDLENLIKRTKEREQENFRSNTPKSIIEISSEDDIFQEQASLHSEATVILQHLTDNPDRLINSTDNNICIDDNNKRQQMDVCDYENIVKV